MINEKEWEEKFKNINKGRENEGFIEWKAFISEQISSLDINSLDNLLKRKEIALKEQKEVDEFRFSFFAGHFVAIVIMLIPFIGTIILTAFDIQVAPYDFSDKQELIGAYAEIVRSSIQNITDTLVSWSVYSGVICIIICGIAKILDEKIIKRRCMKKIYLEEVVEVLKEKLEKKRNRSN